MQKILFILLLFISGSAMAQTRTSVFDTLILDFGYSGRGEVNPKIKHIYVWEDPIYRDGYKYNPGSPFQMDEICELCYRWIRVTERIIYLKQIPIT